MATEKRLIDANAVLKKMQNWNTKERLINCVEDAPTVDAVSRGVHDQVRWERDVAIQQLEEHGIPFGGIAPDVVKVVHGRWEDVKETSLYVPDMKYTVTHTAETCSACKVRIGFIGSKPYLYDNICPNCGAKMDGGNENGC